MIPLKKKEPAWFSYVKNAFDVEKYLNHNLTFSKDTEFEMFRIDVTEDEIRQIEIIIMIPLKKKEPAWFSYVSTLVT